MSPGIRSYRDLIAWQRAFAMGLDVYRITKELPDSERYGLTSQLRRSAISVASNIAEGYGRGSSADYLRFLKVARGSLYELDTQLMFAVELGYVGRDRYAPVHESWSECERVLAGLIRGVERGS